MVHNNPVLLGVLFAVLGRVSQGEETKVPSLQRPTLTVSRTGQVVRLECMPPTDSTKVYSLRLRKLYTYAEHSHTHNESLVSVVAPTLQPTIENLAITADAKATFQGEWNATAVLVVTMPLELGDYFCTGEYGNDDKDYTKFTTRVTVDKEERSKEPTTGVGGYKLQLIPVRPVSVSWSRSVSTSDFIEARVSKHHDSEPARSLFFTMSDHKEFLTHSDVILSSFRLKDGSPNVTLYIREDGNGQEAGTHYNCLVSYRDCVGSNAQLCKCSPEQECLSSDTILSVFLGIAILVIIILVVMIFLVKHNRCKSILCLMYPKPTLRPGHQEEASSDMRPPNPSPTVQETRLTYPPQSRTAQPRQRPSERTPAGQEAGDESTSELLGDDSCSGEVGNTDSSASGPVGNPEESASNSQNAPTSTSTKSGPCPIEDKHIHKPEGGQADLHDVSAGKGSQNRSVPGSVSAAGAPAAQSADIHQGGARP